MFEGAAAGAAAGLLKLKIKGIQGGTANFYRMLQDMNLKSATDYPLVLSYDMIKALNIDSALVSVMIKIIFFSIMQKNCHILLCA